MRIPGRNNFSHANERLLVIWVLQGNLEGIIFSITYDVDQLTMQEMKKKKTHIEIKNDRGH